MGWAEVAARLAAEGEAELRQRAVELERLAAAADEHELQARSERTRTAYAGDWAHFARWCARLNLLACPADPVTVRMYLTDLERLRTDGGALAYQPATLARRLAAIAAAHRDAGHPSPTRDPSVTSVLTGIRRQRHHTPHQMRPLLLEDVRTLLADMDFTSWPAGLTSARDALALLVGFAGALRRSEAAALTLGDLRWHRADGPLLTIRSSKTDQKGQSQTLALGNGRYPGTCPSCVALRWLRLLAAHGRGRPALMRAVLATPPWPDWTHLYRHPTPAPDARPPTAADPGEEPDEAHELATGLPDAMALLRGVRRGGWLMPEAISGDALHAMIRRRAAAAGLDGPHGYHSLRAGFVTQTRRAGASHREVRRQTRHRGDAMVDLYDRDGAPLLGNALPLLGL